MSHNVQDFTLHAGDEDIEEFTTRDPQGVIVPITGATAIRWTLTPNAGAAAVVTKTLGAGVTITDGPNGMFEVSLDEADTLSLAADLYYHEGEMTLGGRKKTVVTGTVTVVPTTP